MWSKNTNKKPSIQLRKEMPVLKIDLHSPTRQGITQVALCHLVTPLPRSSVNFIELITFLFGGHTGTCSEVVLLALHAGDQSPKQNT